MKKIEIRLKEILKERKMQQKDLAELTGIRPNTISNYCRGFISSITIEHLEKIMDVLEVQLTDILVVKDKD